MLFAPKRYRLPTRRSRIRTVMGAAVLASLAGLAPDGRASEQQLQAKASDPAATVRLLTAPHTGRTICNIADSTQLKFFRRAKHGPHRYAEVEVLQGDCAGERGYVPLRSLDPQPRAE